MENKPSITLPQAGELLLSTRIQREVSENYVTTLRAMLAKLSRQFPGPLAGLNVIELEAWLATMKARTSNNYLALLRQLVRFARRRKLVPADFDLDAIDRRIVQSEELKIYSPGEVRRILAACDAHVLPVVLLTVFAGVRTAEVLRMSWAAVDWERKTIEVTARQSKTRSRRICAMNPNLEAWLAGCVPEAVSPRAEAIFPRTRKAFGDRLREALDGAGVTRRRNGLRHSFVSYHLATGESAARTAMSAGHSEAMLFRNYRELVTERAAREFWEIWPDGGQLDLPLAA